MADLVYTDITWTIIIKDMWRKQRANTWSVAFGGAGKTYPDSGLPLGATVAGALKQLGMGRFADVELLNATKDGYIYMFDQILFTIRKFQTAAHTPTGTAAGQVFTGSSLATHVHDLKVMGGAGTIDEPIGVEGTDTLAKDAATDRTIVGANYATKGGVVPITAGTPAGTNAASALTIALVAAGVLTEVPNEHTAAATVIRLRAIGV